ncbi:carbohydrate ABC transporter permease [Paenibacillus glycanilyticus]|uniref:carbohydrate ABC transporter permease n=1 Tax=Paenibacillus glycanilyticus TaxID=126569 RepID=UPI002040709E|nr:carbohydrate ABC transporter permease [Paenibacillus glycanilyticus]MCM3629714.1 carbohydrate ABC transporter permease [Paenibacillus glycanilyticus]
MANFLRARFPGWIRFAVLLLFLAAALLPFYWLFVTSLKDRQEIYGDVLTLWPANLTWNNYIETFRTSDFLGYFKNSLIVSLSSGLLVLIVSIFGGYALARYRFRGKGVILLIFLTTQMVPVMILLVPLFIVFGKLALLNTLGALIITYTALNIPFCLITMSGFFQQTPVALEEAAMIDGCSRLSTVARITLPIMLPGLVATFVFAFMGAWNDLFFGVMFTTSEHVKTVPVGLNGFVQKFDVNWGEMSAGGMVSLIPVAILFALIQRYIVSGLSQGAVKG